MRLDILLREAEIKLWISENKSKAWITRQLDCKPETLETYLKKLGLDYKGNKSGKGIKESPYRLTVDELANKSWVNSHKLKLRLLKDHIKEHRCEICNTTEWLGNQIPLELDHIDGNHYNNVLENLRLVCPNCHAQMPTNGGKNTRKPK